MKKPEIVAKCKIEPKNFNANVFFITRIAAGFQKRVSTRVIFRAAEKVNSIVEKLLSETIRTIPHDRNYPCAHAQENIGVLREK